MNSEQKPEKERSETPQAAETSSTKSTLKSVGNTVAAAGIFSTAIIGLLKYLEAVEKLPTEMRHSLYLLCVIVLSVTVSIFGISIANLLWMQSRKDVLLGNLEREKQQKQHEIDLLIMENKKKRARIEGQALDKQLDVEDNSKAVFGDVTAAQSPPQQKSRRVGEAPVDVARYSRPEEKQQIIEGQTEQ